MSPAGDTFLSRSIQSMNMTTDNVEVVLKRIRQTLLVNPRVSINLIDDESGELKEFRLVEPPPITRNQQVVSKIQKQIKQLQAQLKQLQILDSIFPSSSSFSSIEPPLVSPLFTDSSSSFPFF